MLWCDGEVGACVDRVELGDPGRGQSEDDEVELDEELLELEVLDDESEELEELEDELSLLELDELEEEPDDDEPDELFEEPERASFL